MNKNEYFDRYFKIQDDVKKIKTIIISIDESNVALNRARMVVDMARFVSEWTDRNLRFNKGFFWEIRKKLLRDEILKRTDELNDMLKYIYSTDCFIE